MELVTCYNKGCGSKFDPSKNADNACKFHPGGPIFHDAMKGWSCCKKRSTDFTEFLNFPGCTTGPHSDVKPVEPEKPAKDVNIPEVEESTDKPQMMKQKVEVGEVERPSPDEPRTRLKLTVTPSLEKALEKCLQQMSIENTAQTEMANGDSVKVGTSCKNSGCKGSYTSADSDTETCLYHPGGPVFHEGMKYWSCCQRKTSEFSNFLDQEGCEKGKHLWVKTEAPDSKKKCRHDWFQTGPNVNISVFSKAAVPDKTYVEVNQVVCHIYITYEGGKSLFEQTFVLRNAIVPEKCEVKLLGTKVEVVLRKAEAFSWPSLEYKPPTPAEAAQSS